MRRLAGATIVAVLLAASLAEAQRGGWGRAYERWGGEAGVPPRYATEVDQDGGFHFCRLEYTAVRAQQRGMGWGTDYPFADINFSIRLSEMTKTVVSKKGQNPNHIVVKPTDEWLSMCPFVMASDPGSAGFSPEDAQALRNYLLKGGFLWVDDYWGPYAWEDFAREIATVLPPGQYPIKDLMPDHPIYRALFEVAEIPQVPAWRCWSQTGEGHLGDGPPVRACAHGRHHRQAGPHHGADDAQHRHRRLVGARGRGARVLLRVFAQRLRARHERGRLCDDPLTCPAPPGSSRSCSSW
jgi:hypothetical protein